jgi:hypothetical protein
MNNRILVILVLCVVVLVLVFLSYVAAHPATLLGGN